MKRFEHTEKSSDKILLLSTVVEKAEKKLYFREEFFQKTIIVDKWDKKFLKFFFIDGSIDRSRSYHRREKAVFSGRIQFSSISLEKKAVLWDFNIGNNFKRNFLAAYKKVFK